jgi:Uma2 family endonuclease
MQTFARFGVPEYWIVDPANRVIEVYRLADGIYGLEQVAGGGDVLASPTLEGLAFKAARLFP